MVVAWLSAGMLPYYSLRKESETPGPQKQPAEEPIYNLLTEIRFGS